MYRWHVTALERIADLRDRLTLAQRNAAATLLGAIDTPHFPVPHVGLTPDLLRDDQQLLVLYWEAGPRRWQVAIESDGACISSGLRAEESWGRRHDWKGPEGTRAQAQWLLFGRDADRPADPLAAVADAMPPTTAEELYRSRLAARRAQQDCREAAARRRWLEAQQAGARSERTDDLLLNRLRSEALAAQGLADILATPVLSPRRIVDWLNHWMRHGAAPALRQLLDLRLAATEVPPATERSTFPPFLVPDADDADGACTGLVEIFNALLEPSGIEIVVDHSRAHVFSLRFVPPPAPAHSG